jgi:hypothetical protein
MQIRGTIEGDVRQLLSKYSGELAAAMRQAMDNASNSVLADVKSRTKAAGLGNLAKAWGKRLYPTGGKPSISPAALVYGKSKTLFPVFTEGATIVPRKGRFLAIPTPQAEAMGLAQTSVRRDGKGTGSVPRRLSMVQKAIKSLGEKNIKVIPAKRGRLLMVYEVPQGRGAGRSFRGRGGRGIGYRRGASVPLFILVPQVRIGRKLDLSTMSKAASAALAAAVRAQLVGS